MAERLVVIGGDAAGLSGATNARRGRPDLEIVVLEQGRDTSYSACGIPYVVGGDIDDLDDLVVNTPQNLRDKYRLDVRTRHVATGIDLDAGQVEVRSLDQGRSFRIGFDLLHVATGASPIRPDLPGIDGPGIFGVQSLADARQLLDAVSEGKCRQVVVVGAGYIGIEMAEAFMNRGAQVTMVDGAEQPMGTLDPELAKKVSEAIRRFGIELLLGESVEGFEPGKVLLDGRSLDADLVILGIGVKPNASLGTDAGLDAGAKGAISVDHRQLTSHEAVYSAGDCADVRHRVTGEKVHIALGTVANRTGRVAGVNMGGGYASFPGVLGTAVTRVCAVEIARTGLNEAEAGAAGIEFATGVLQSTTRAGYFPGAERLDLRILIEKGTTRVLGGQVVGADRAGKRIDVVATAITAGLTAQEFIDLDLAYAPAVSPLWEPFQIAARKALAALD